MYTPEEAEMIIRTQSFEEEPKINNQTRKYVIVPIEDPENCFISFNLVLEEDYQEIEKLKQKTLKK